MKRWVCALAFACVTLRGQTLPQTREIDPDHVTILKGLHGAYAVIMPNIDRPALTPRSSTCAVPLLRAPINPNVDHKMPILKPPKSPAEGAEIVKGPPPCPSDRSR